MIGKGLCLLHTCAWQYPLSAALNPPEELEFFLVFDDPANFPVIDPNDVNEWNALLVSTGTPFISVSIAFNEVTLVGYAGVGLSGALSGNPNLIYVYDPDGVVTSCMPNEFNSCSELLSITMDGLLAVPGGFCTNNLKLLQARCAVALSIGDYAFQGTSIESINFPAAITVGLQAFEINNSCISVTMGVCQTMGISALGQMAAVLDITLDELITAGDAVCGGDVSLQTFRAPLCTAIGSGFFFDCTSLIEINLTSCTDFGGTTGDDNVFQNVLGVTCNLIVPAFLETCDGGNPDGDLVTFLANNPASIITYI